MSQGPTPSSPPPPSAAAAPEARPFASKGRVLTAFVNNCVETVTKAALALDTAGHHRPHARNLIKALWEKRRILVTCHAHPDPDALASCCGVIELLRTQLPDAAVDLSIKGQAPGGLNEIFLLESKAKSVPWESLQAESYDAIVLLDTHPGAGNNPLPASATLTAVIDHHQRRGRRPAIPFVDIRPSIGATCSLVFSYFMELDVPISPGLAALLLFGIETDLAGAAAQPTGWTTWRYRA